MKKIIPALFALLTLGAAGATVYLFQKSSHGSGAAAAITDDLPKDTLLLLSIPDFDQTCTDWKTTDLYKIWTEPEVQAFVAKPLSRLPADARFGDTFARMAKLEPKNIFVAVTALDEKTNQPHLVAGFQFKGDKADVDALLAPAKENLRQHAPGGKADLINYQGHPVETFDAGDDNFLASVYLGDWYLVANDLTLLKSTVDRVEHRDAPGANDASLDKEPDFQAALAKMPSGYATLIFARMQPFVARLYALAAASGQSIDATQRAEADKVRAFGASTKIENGKLRDTVYVLAPGHRALPATLAMSALPLTTADTLFFATGVFNIPASVAIPPEAAPGATAAPAAAGGLAALRGMMTMLETHGVKMADLRAAFGNETEVQLDWPASSAQPSLIASLDVRDHALADKFVDNFANTLNAEASWQVTQANGLIFHTMSAPGVSFVSPTITLSDRHFILGLNLPDVQDTARREKTNTPNFTQGEAYKTAAASVGKPNLAFAYLDSRPFFERAYGALKPLAMLGSAFMFPHVGDYVDLAKLPEPETISKHLSPTVLSESSDDQGVLLESVGSFTFNQAAVVLPGAAAAIALPIYLRQNAEKAPDEPPASQPSSTTQPNAGE